MRALAIRSLNLKRIMIRFKILKNWKLWLVAIAPLVLLPIAFIGDSDEDSKKFKCGYVIILMGLFWVTEALPLAITAVIPVVLFPVLGIQSTAQVAPNYMRETGMMFFGSISLALGIQYSGLDKRIALRTIVLIGLSPWRLLLGKLVTSMVLSCFINSAALAAMMIPIIIGLIDSLDGLESDKRRKELKKLYMLAVCYAANVGGTSVMIGSNSNLIYAQLIELENVGQDGKYLDVNFVSWIAFSMPIGIINLMVIWFILGTMYLGFGFRKKEDLEGKEISTTAEKLNLIMKKKLSELGSITFHEKGIIVLYAIAIPLSLLRDPRVFPGWLSIFKHGMNIADPSVMVGATILAFIIPKDAKYFTGDYSGFPEGLMNWQYLQKHFPWNVLLLVGGGLAISDGANVSGLSLWIGDNLNGLDTVPRPVTLFTLLIFMSFFTEVASNAASISIITPIIIALSKRLGIHPLYLSFPGVIACQYAFMLPTSNPPNALIYTAGDMKMSDMVKAGVLTNLACLAVLFLMNISWGEYVIFNYSDYEYPAVNCTECAR